MNAEGDRAMQTGTGRAAVGRDHRGIGWQCVQKGQSGHA